MADAIRKSALADKHATPFSSGNVLRVPTEVTPISLAAEAVEVSRRLRSHHAALIKQQEELISVALRFKGDYRAQLTRILCEHEKVKGYAAQRRRGDALLTSMGF